MTIKPEEYLAQFDLTRADFAIEELSLLLAPPNLATLMRACEKRLVRTRVLFWPPTAGRFYTRVYALSKKGQWYECYVLMRSQFLHTISISYYKSDVTSQSFFLNSFILSEYVMADGEKQHGKSEEFQVPSTCLLTVFHSFFLIIVVALEKNFRRYFMILFLQQLKNEVENAQKRCESSAAKVDEFSYFFYLNFFVLLFCAIFQAFKTREHLFWELNRTIPLSIILNINKLLGRLQIEYNCWKRREMKNVKTIGKRKFFSATQRHEECVIQLKKKTWKSIPLIYLGRKLELHNLN